MRGPVVDGVVNFAASEKIPAPIEPVRGLDGQAR
jgi:hypothetical protein